MKSDYLNQAQLTGLLKVGDILIPKSNLFPCFSEVGCIEHIDSILSEAHAADRKELAMICRFFNYLPCWCLKLIFKLSTQHEKFPDLIGTQLRMLNLGVNGIVYSLYYSNMTGKSYQGKKIFDVIDYHVQCKPDPVLEE